MKKAVLISMKPKNVELVLNRYETLEICKTRPLLETPFKCYIYCTAGNLSYKVNGGMVCNVSGGKMVVGEFVCDKITWLTHIGFSGLPWIRLAAMKNGHTIDDSFDFSESCLTTPQIEKYLAVGMGTLGTFPSWKSTMPRNGSTISSCGTGIANIPIWG